MEQENCCRCTFEYTTVTRKCILKWTGDEKLIMLDLMEIRENDFIQTCKI